MSTEPRNRNEAQIVRARAGMANADRLWSSQPVNARKSDTSAAVAPASHLSAFGGLSTMKSTEMPISRQSDPLDALPASVKEKAKGFDAGQRALLAFVYEKHAKTGKPVPIDAGEAAKTMEALDITTITPAGTYGTVSTFLEVLDDLDAVTRQRAAMGFLQRMPDPDDEPGSLPLRRVLLALLDIAVVDGVIFDFDSKAQPIGLSVRHLRRLIDMREDADRRPALAAHHVRQDDLSKLFDDIASEAQSAGLH